MASFLPSRPAWDHRARVHLAHGENRKELPSIYSEASKKENINKKIKKIFGRYRY